MKAFLYFILVSLLLLSCNQNNESKVVSATDTIDVQKIDTTKYYNLDSSLQMHITVDTFYLGDMNADGKKDTVIVYSPMHSYGIPDGSSPGGCEDDSCLTQVKFSFTPIVLKHNNALGFQTLFSTGDLNSDGTVEIAFIPNWFTSCWQGLFVYSFTKDSWKKIGTASVHACSEEDFSKRVSRIDDHSFRLISKTFIDGDAVDTTLVMKW